MMNKNLLRYYLVFFILFFLIINWKEISWVFSPTFLKRAISKPSRGFLETKSTDLLKSSTEKGSEKKGEDILLISNEEQAKKGEKEKKEEFKIIKNQIIIPKLGIEAPLVFVNEEKEIKEALDMGVVHYPFSALPGTKGATVLLGHSAPPNWPKIKYDWVFSRISELEKGDRIEIFFKNQKFVYSVQNRYFLARGEELPKVNEEKESLFLVSCWPPGKDFKRIAVLALMENEKEISPSY